MSILARVQNIEVEVLSTFTTGDGRKLATVRALRGKPFTDFTHGGPADSAAAQVPVSFLRDVRQDPQAAPSKPNLLQMALAAHKPQWYNGESLWLVRNGNQGAFLKNDGNGFVTLNVTGCSEYLNFFFLDMMSGTWVPCRDLENKYQSWARKAQEAMKK